MPKLSEDGNTYDLIIAIPKVGPSKKDYRKALKAYRYLIDRCLRLLEPNGLLLVASCSHAVGLEDMRQLLQQQSKGNIIELDVVAPPISQPTTRGRWHLLRGAIYQQLWSNAADKRFAPQNNYRPCGGEQQGGGNKHCR